MSKQGFTAKKAQFLNYKEDGLKTRSSRFESKKLYNRKVKHSKTRDE